MRKPALSRWGFGPSCKGLFIYLDFPSTQIPIRHPSLLNQRKITASREREAGGESYLGKQKRIPVSRNPCKLYGAPGMNRTCGQRIRS